MVLCAWGPAWAMGPHRPYQQLYVFGDSYSDSGAGYVDTNGATAVQVLAEKLGIAFTYAGDKAATPDDGLNYAVSGAQTGAGNGKHYPHGEFLSYGMKNQVGDFVTAVQAGRIRFDPGETMFFLAGGLNDGNLTTDVTVANLESEIEALYAAGGRRFMVAVLPEKIPAFSRVALRLNPALAGIPAEMRAKHQDMRIEMSGWGKFFDRVMETPEEFGITDTTHTCAGRLLKEEDQEPCSSADRYYYFHAGHPSTAVHWAVGEMLYEEAVGKRK